MKRYWAIIAGVSLLLVVVCSFYGNAEARAGTEISVRTEAKTSTAEQEAQKSHDLLKRRLLQTALIIFAGYLLIFILVGIINSRIKDLRLKHLVRKNVIYLLNFLMLLFAVFVWLRNISSVTIFFSVVGAGVALALQEVILCVAGWFLIIARRPFEVGDRIEIGGVKGDVIDIRLFQTSVLEIGNWVDADQSTGRIVNIPNSAIFKSANYNYSRGFEFIWNEIRILVTFESDRRRAEEIILSHARAVTVGMEDVAKKKIHAMTAKYMIHYEKFTPIVYTNIKESGIELTLRYLTEARMRRATQDELCRAILDDFAKEEKVNFAYTTYRLVR